MVDFHLFADGPAPVAPYSHATESDGWVILTGQVPNDPADDGAPFPAGIEAQTRRVMDNLALVLGEIGLDLSHVVQCRCFLIEFERQRPAVGRFEQAGPVRSSAGEGSALVSEKLALEQ